MSEPRLTLLVPAYDEEANLAANLPQLSEVAGRCTPDHEILVVDDGSRDRTAEVVERMRAREPRIRLVRHRRNLGPGAAIPTGLFWARGEWILLVPADLACEPGELVGMWEARQGADIVVGLRSDRRDYTPWRRLLSRAYIAILHASTGSRLRQYNYIQMWRRAIFERIAPRSRGVFVTAEILLRAERAGLNLVEFPMTYQPRIRGRAAGASPRALVRTAYEMGRHLFTLEAR